MCPAQTRLEALPEVFPVFPLTGALLLPRGQLPLNIFEPRYLALTEDALANGRVFAMIQPDRTKPSLNHGPSLFRVGCLGRLTSFAETDDGRYLITLTGLARFDIVEEVEMQRGYRRVHGNFRRFAADLLPQEITDFDRPGLVEALRQYFSHRGFDANWKAIDAMEDERCSKPQPWPTVRRPCAPCCASTATIRQTLMTAAPPRAVCRVEFRRHSVHECRHDRARYHHPPSPS